MHSSNLALFSLNQSKLAFTGGIDSNNIGAHVVLQIQMNNMDD